MIAETLYKQLPPSRRAEAKRYPGQGRKLLCFADSRQSAAYFGPYLEDTHLRHKLRWITFAALRNAVGPQLAPVNLSVLGSAGHALHRAHANYSAALSFFLGLAAWQWFPRLEKQAADPARVRRLKWAAVILALLVVAMAVVPRPFVFDRYEVVNYANEPAFVIGANSDSLLLYSPRNGQKRWRVRKDDAAVQHGGSTGRIFDSQ